MNSWFDGFVLGDMDFLCGWTMSFSQIPTLAVLIKRPSFRRGLPQLSSDLGPATSLDIAEHLLACAMEDARSFPGRVVLVISRSQDEEWARSLLENVEILVSDGRGKAHMLGAVDGSLRQLGHQKIIYMDTRSPLLDQRDYFEMIARLAKWDVAVRSDPLGRLVLLASQTGFPVDNALTWETPKAALELVQQCEAEGLEVFESTSDKYLDVGGDLYLLAEALKAQPRPARQSMAKYLKMKVRAGPQTSTATG